MPRTLRIDGLCWGNVFLAIAVWDTLMAAAAATVWPRVYDMQTLQFMTPRSLLLPVAICVVLAALLRSTRPARVAAVVAVASIAAITVVAWSPQSQAWLNVYTG